MVENIECLIDHLCEIYLLAFLTKYNSNSLAKRQHLLFLSASTEHS